MPEFKDRKSLLYRIASISFRFWMKIFFNKIDIRHGQNIPASGPVVFVANHPNSIMDGFVVRGLLKRKVNFIAHAGLFNQPFLGWGMRKTGNIPVFVKRNDPELMEQNVNMFAECTATLERGETIFVFPEGVSDSLRKVKKIKTGAARIVLESEAKHDYQLGIRLVPIGLHFYSRSRFNSRVLINVGEPIELAPFSQQHAATGFEAVRALTKEIEARLRALVVNVENEELDSLAREIEEIYSDSLRAAFAQLSPPARKSMREEFFISQAVAECAQFLLRQQPQRLAQVQKAIQDYTRKLKHLRLRDTMLRANPASQKRIWLQIGKAYLILLPGLIPALYGIINHYIPYRISNYLARHFVYERTKILTALFVGGGLAFNFFYVVQTAAVSAMFGFTWGILYLLTLPFFGFFALSFVEKVREQKENMLFAIYLLTNKNLIRRMRRQRKLLLQMLDSIRDEYLAEVSSGPS